MQTSCKQDVPRQYATTGACRGTPRGDSPGFIATSVNIARNTIGVKPRIHGTCWIILTTCLAVGLVLISSGGIIIERERGWWGGRRWETKAFLYTPNHQTLEVGSNQNGQKNQTRVPGSVVHTLSVRNGYVGEFCFCTKALKCILPQRVRMKGREKKSSEYEVQTLCQTRLLSWIVRM